jgi:hypothetical protein
MLKEPSINIEKLQIKNAKNVTNLLGILEHSIPTNGDAKAYAKHAMANTYPKY